MSNPAELVLGTVDLLDGTKYTMVPDGFDFPTPRRGATRRTGTIIVHVRGTTKEGLLDNWREIEQQLDKAQGPRYPVRLRAQFGSEDVRIDVLSGTISADGAAVRWIDGGAIRRAVITLECLPWWYGDEVTLSESSALTNGTATLYLTSIPGDLDAIGTITIDDQSTNSHVLNRLRIARVSGSDLLEADFDPTVTVTPIDSGASVAGDSDTVSDPIARLTTGSQWATFAEFTRPTANTHGHLDLWGRIRDHVALLGAASNVTGVATDGISERQTAVQNVTSAATITATFPEATESGTTLTLALYGRGTNYDAAVSSIPANWTLSAETNTTDRRVSLYYMTGGDNGGGITSVQVDMAASVDDLGITLTEWRGITSSSPEDVTATNVEASGTQTHPTGTTGTTAQANALALTMHTRADTRVVYTYTSDYTELSSPDEGMQHWYSVLEATGTQDATLTLSGTGSSQTSANLIAVFKGDSTSVPDLTAGTYRYWIVPYDSSGNRGSLSIPITVQLDATGAITLSWAESPDSPAGYYVYWRRDSNDILRLDAGDNLSFVHATETGATTEDPEQDLEPALLRARVGPGENAVVFDTLPIVQGSIGGEQWEDVHLGTLYFDEDWDDWIVQIQGRSDSPGDHVDIDILWALPHDEAQVTARWVSTGGVELDSATSRKLQITTQRDLRTRSLWLDRSTDDSVAVAPYAGRFLLGPGNNLLIFQAHVADGVSDTEDCTFTATVSYTPRFRYLRGTS